MTGPITGGWVADRLGLWLHTAPDSGRAMPELVEVALRRNPKRAHLLVSTVLGKHLPTDPRLVFGAAEQLGRLVGVRLDAPAPLVIGYAETATGLGHVVAQTLAADYLHSTRRPVAGVAAVAGFEEPHSHATSHLLLPAEVGLLSRLRPVVLVDDELSTGRTAMNTIRALHAEFPRAHYVIAALADLRSAAERAAMSAFAAELGVRVETVALGRGGVTLPVGFAAEAGGLAARVPAAPAVRRAAGVVRRVESGWPPDVRDGGRHGFGVPDVAAARVAAHDTADAVAPGLAGSRVLVLGFEELMYAPLLIALALADLGIPASFSSTSRSPVLALDEPGYPIRTALRFPAHDCPADGPGERFAYNVAPAGGSPAFSDIVLVVDEPGDTAPLQAADGLLAQLTTVAGRVHLVVLPSYQP